MKFSEKEKERLEVFSEEILNHPSFQTLQSFVQHGSVTTYEHSLHVTNCAFWLNARLHTHADERELVTACLLHDFYLYDWHTKGDRLHGYHHPKTAAKYAKICFHVSDRVVSAIETHMWPLTLFHIPSNRTAWLLTIADKICSIQETLRR